MTPRTCRTLADSSQVVRFARGHTFYVAARAAVQSLGVPFAWTRDTGAGHTNRMMVPRAAEILAERDRG